MDELLSDYLTQFFQNAPFRLYQLAGDASARKYFRVIKDQQSWVLMKWEPFRPEDYPFLSVQQHFLKAKVHVPKVVDLAPDKGLMLLEDLGDLTLERKFSENLNPDTWKPFYDQALDELIKIHFLATKTPGDCTAFHVAFDVEKLLWEMNYGRTHLIHGVCKHESSDAEKKELDQIFLDVCTRLHQEPKFIAHRDYHSRNLMIKFDEVRVIDFQDARMGALQYDLVSLLRDSYVSMSDADEKSLIDVYLEKAKPYLPKDFSKEWFLRIYELQSIQRCFKACGSFSSFYNQREDKRYLKYITPTLKRVIKSLNEFPEYKTFSRILVDSGALDRKYELL